MADGMVSGAAHTTAHTIRPAFEIIKTAAGRVGGLQRVPDGLADRVLVYGDCAVIPDPTAEQLADIAISVGRDRARSSGSSRGSRCCPTRPATPGPGRTSTRCARRPRWSASARPDLAVDGPIQYDAAADAAVAKAKLPDSAVAGRATVFIFPDLNTGNNTYKAVQRSAGAVAIGPVLQGLRLPVNDLSRGATGRGHRQHHRDHRDPGAERAAGR